MNDRPPPSLGTYRRPLERRPNQSTGEGDHGPVDHEAMPRILTAPPRNPNAPPRTTSGKRPGNRSGKRRTPVSRSDDEGGSGIRWLAYSLLILLATAGLAAAAAFLLIPTDLVRDRLQAEIKSRTGRDLIMAGTTSLALWPRPAVSVTNVTLSSPAAMGSQPLMKVAEIDVAIQLLPLLLHDLVIDRLVLRQPVIDLHIDAKGQRSWDFAAADLPVWSGRTVRLAQAGDNPAKLLPRELQDFVRGATDQKATEPAPAPNASRLSDLTLGNVSISDGRVRYRDDRTGADETVSSLNATLSLANIASPLGVMCDYTWRSEPVHVAAQLSPFRGLLEGRAIQAQVKAAAAPLTLTFDGFAAVAGDLDLDGRVTAKVAELRRLATWTGKPFGGSLPGGLAIDAKLKQTGSLTALSDARLNLGALAGSGSLSVDGRGPKPIIKGALHVPALDLNMLQALVETAAVTSAQPPAAASLATATSEAKPKSIEDLLGDKPPATGGKPQVRGYKRAADWSDEAIDFSAMGLADADLKLGFDRLLWHDVITGPGQVAVALKSKTARLTLDDTQLYDGRVRGIVTVDATADAPTIGGNFVADGVSTLPFLTALSGFDWISGRGRVAIAIAGRGATERQFVSSMNGRSEISVTDGAIVGLNIAGIVRNIGQGKLAGLNRNPAEKTEFSEFTASTVITNGIAKNSDLRLVGPLVQANGAGTIELPARTIDYVLRPMLGRSSPGSPTQAGLEIPLKITGSVDKPTVIPDVSGALKDPAQAMQVIQDMAKTPAGKEVQETVKGLINGDPAARSKAKGFLDQLLKK